MCNVHCTFHIAHCFSGLHCNGKGFGHTAVNICNDNLNGTGFRFGFISHKRNIRRYRNAVFVDVENTFGFTGRKTAPDGFDKGFCRPAVPVIVIIVDIVPTFTDSQQERFIGIIGFENTEPFILKFKDGYRRPRA